MIENNAFPVDMRLRRSARREEILMVAAQQFRERGYKATTMRDLAKAVGIEAASFYNHFSSKDAILYQICFQTGNLFLDNAQQIFYKMETETQSAETTLRHLLDMHIATTCADTHAAFLTDNEWKYLPEPHRAAFKQIRKSYENIYEMVIKTGIERGEFRPIDPTVAMFTILSGVRWLQYWYRPNRQIPHQDLQNAIQTLMLNGLSR